MEQATQNKMAVEPMKRLFWEMGLPMIVSMVLQALGIRRKTARVGVFAVDPVYLPRRVFVHAVRKRACARVVDVPHSGDPHLRFLLPVFKTGGQENSGYGELR